MKAKKALLKLRPLLNKASFTSQEAKRIGVSSASLAYYVKEGELRRIGRGIYAGRKAPMVSDFKLEGIVEACQRAKEGVVCLISALIIYELTDEMPSQYWIAIRHDTIHRPGQFTKVVRMRNLELGRTSITVDGIVLPIFDRERTIVDAFRYLGKEIAIKALREALTKRGKEKIQIEKLRSYAKKLRVNIDPYLMAFTT